jgi:hypothetical protein
MAAATPGRCALQAVIISQGSNVKIGLGSSLLLLLLFVLRLLLFQSPPRPPLPPPPPPPPLCPTAPPPAPPPAPRIGPLISLKKAAIYGCWKPSLILRAKPEPSLAGTEKSLVLYKKPTFNAAGSQCPNYCANHYPPIAADGSGKTTDQKQDQRLPF